MSKFEYNKNQYERDAMLSGYWVDRHDPFDNTAEAWPGGCRYFKGVPYEAAKMLLDFNYADPEDRHDHAPSFGEITEWLKYHQKFRAHGYAVISSRSDYRVTIEGVELSDLDAELTTTDLHELEKMFPNADQISYVRGRVWYD